MIRMVSSGMPSQDFLACSTVLAYPKTCHPVLTPQGKKPSTLNLGLGSSPRFKRALTKFRFLTLIPQFLPINSSIHNGREYRIHVDEVLFPNLDPVNSLPPFPACAAPLNYNLGQVPPAFFLQNFRRPLGRHRLCRCRNHKPAKGDRSNGFTAPPLHCRPRDRIPFSHLRCQIWLIWQ